METRAVATMLGIGAGLVTVIGSSGAGEAAALTPFVVPEAGLYSVELSHSETVALRDSPLPGLLNPLWHDYGVAMVLPPSSTSEVDPVRGEFSDVVAQSAGSAFGSVVIAFLGATEPDSPAAGRHLVTFGFVD
ncbi:hypothetical protein [Nocardia sp. NPDC057030]|uniref:hypothetical protein n=1 Tax=unclassified Nocardia TaxID=2637762 RepID=UPI00362CF3C4